MDDTSIDEAKKKLSLYALARAIMARAEAAGMSVTEWLAEESRAAERRVFAPRGTTPNFFTRE